LEKKFDVYLPFDKVSKSEDSETSNIIVSGWASTSKRDLQGEIIDSHGINASYLISDGFVDYEHDRDKVIGYPTDNSYVDQEKGLFVEAELFGNDDNVKNIMKLYSNLKEAKAPRHLGFSIEGIVKDRDDTDENIVRDVNITGVAVTKNPANTDATWEILQKSILTDKALETGHGITPGAQQDGAAFRTESLEGSLINIASALNGLDDVHLKILGNDVATALDGLNVHDDETVATFIQLFSGVSRQDALKIVDTSKVNNDFKKLTQDDSDSDDDDSDDDSDDD